MKKTVSVVILFSAAILACSQKVFDFNGVEKMTIIPEFDAEGYWKTPDFRLKKDADGNVSLYSSNSLYGAVLAARVAYGRRDFKEAAEYYKIALEKDPQNEAINRTVSEVMMYTGDWNRAAFYAKNDLKNADKNNKINLVSFIIAATKDFKDGNYAQVREETSILNDNQFYKSLVNPLFEAWSFAGEKNEKSAVLALNKIKDERYALLKLMHSGLIYDYLGDYQKADEAYKKILNSYSKEVTYRLLEVMINFYVRHNQKDFALQIYNTYNEKGAMAVLLNGLRQQIEKTEYSENVVMDTPQKGFAEVMFNIGTLYRSANFAEPALAYLSSSVYLNPDYEIYKFALANLYENIGLYNEANNIYAQIDKDSSSYYLASLKTVENLNTLKDYKKAEQRLRELLKEYPDNSMLLSDLADVMREQGQTKDAIKLYHKALEVQKEPDANVWPVYYALGALYYQENERNKAVEYLQNALNLSGRNPNVLNYLGYIYLEDDTNTDKAVQMILDAYSNYSYDGHIIDSLGWVFFRLGQYDKAVYFLEQAADVNPANAVICNHLGDAYWFVGRKNEAVYQWRHALDLKEDADYLDKAGVQNKIDSGEVENKVLKLTNPLLAQKLEQITQN